MLGGINIQQTCDWKLLHASVHFDHFCWGSEKGPWPPITLCKYTMVAELLTGLACTLQYVSSARTAFLENAKTWEHGFFVEPSQSLTDIGMMGEVPDLSGANKA